MENREQALLNLAGQLGYLTPEQLKTIQQQQLTLSDYARQYGLASLSMQRLQRLYLQWLLLLAVSNLGIMERQQCQRLLQEKISILRQGQDDGGIPHLLAAGLTPTCLRQALPQLLARRRISQQEADWLEQSISRCQQSDLANYQPLSATMLTKSGATAVTSNNPSPKMLGPYQIFEQIGAGGMGKVYKGYHPQLEKNVAIKVMLKSSEISSHDRERFLAEARLAAQLRHPNIVSVYDVGSAAGIDYLVMDYICGHSLAQELQKTPMSPRRAAKLLKDVAWAMDTAHQQGIVHRDLKPANLMIDQESGRPLVTDFGLAKNINLSSELTKSGDILGTPRYMAPEQARGDQSAISPQTDIYALGAILYEMLTAKPATPGDSPFNIIYNILQKELIPPRQHCPNLARDLETICLKTLAKEPQHRYSSAAELAQDLQRFLDGEMVLARRHHWSYRAWKLIKRQRLAVTALLLIVVAACVAIWWASAHQQQQQWKQCWNNFAGQLQLDYRLLQATDDQYQQAQKLLLKLQQQRSQGIWISEPKINSDDDQLFQYWQQCQSHLEACADIPVKYLQMPEILAKRKDLFNRDLASLKSVLRKFYQLQPTAAPAVQVLRCYLTKSASLYQQAQRAYDCYRNSPVSNGLSQKPEQLQLARQLLRYAASLTRWSQSKDKSSLASAVAKCRRQFVQQRNRIDTLARQIDNIIESTQRLVRNHLYNFQFKADTFDLDRILMLLQQVCRLDGTSGPTYFQIAHIFHNAAKLEDAVLFYYKSHQRQPNLLALYYLSEIYYQRWQTLLQELQTDVRELDDCQNKFAAIQQQLSEHATENLLLRPYQYINAFYRRAMQQQAKILQATPRQRALSGYLNFRLCPINSNYHHQIDPAAFRRGLELYRSLLADLDGIVSDQVHAQIAYLKAQIYFDLGLMAVPVAQGPSYLALALRHYRAALAGQRLNANIWRKTAHAYFALGDFAQAEAAYRYFACLFLTSKSQYGYRFFNRRDHYFFIRCLLNQKKWQEATHELEKHLRFWRRWQQAKGHASPQRMHDPNICRKISLLAALYLVNGQYQALDDILAELKKEIGAEDKISGEIGLIYVVAQLQRRRRTEALRMLKKIWKELAGGWSQATGKGLAVSRMLAAQIRNLRSYADLFAVAPQMRQQLQLIERLLQKYTRNDKWGAGYYQIYLVPLLQRLADFIEAQPQLSEQLRQLTRQVAGQPVELSLLLHLFNKFAIDIAEQRLRYLNDLQSLPLAYSTAVAWYRCGNYARALAAIEFALNRSPAESRYHYSAAILCGNLAAGHESMKNRAAYHLQQALRLGWPAAHLATEPAFRSIHNHPVFTKLRQRTIATIGSYSAQAASEKVVQIANRLGPVTAMQWWRTWQQAGYDADNFANIQGLEAKAAAALLRQARQCLDDRKRLNAIIDCIDHLLSPRQQHNCYRQLARWLWQKVARSGEQNIAQAQADLTRAITLYPECWQAYAQRARIFERNGQLHQANSDRAMALRINPDYASDKTWSADSALPKIK